MIIPTKQKIINHIKWEKSNKYILKIEPIIFYNDMINPKIFAPNLLKIDKKLYKNIGISNIGYITIKKTDDYSVNPLYFQVNHRNGCIAINRN